MNTHKSHINRYRALTLLELMVVIAIIGITLTIAIPLYKTNLYKVNVSAVVNKLSSFKNQMVDYYTANGSWPATLNGANAPATISNTSFTSVTNFRYNNENNKAWWGYKLSSDYGSGWIFMVLLANDDGSYSIHCGSLSNNCSLGYCNSLKYYPSACAETNLSVTYDIE